MVVDSSSPARYTTSLLASPEDPASTRGVVPGAKLQGRPWLLYQFVVLGTFDALVREVGGAAAIPSHHDINRSETTANGRRHYSHPFPMRSPRPLFFTIFTTIHDFLLPEKAVVAVLSRTISNNTGSLLYAKYPYVRAFAEACELGIMGIKPLFASQAK